jgi:TonB family protein
MQKIFILALAAFGFLAPAYSQYYPVDTAVLNNAYRELEKNPTSRKWQQAFFDAFPSTWMEYIMTYQFVPDDNYHSTMYNLGSYHIQAFEKLLPQIPDSAYCHKLIWLCIGGTYGADAPCFLQEIAIQYALKKPQVVFAQLSQLKRGEQLRFWMFCWHSMHKKGDDPQKMKQLKDQMSASHPEEVNTMELGFEYSWGEAHHPPPEEYPHIVKRNELRRLKFRKHISKMFALLPSVRNPDNSFSRFFWTAQKKPQFPWGEERLKAFLAANTRYPAESAKNNVQRHVMIRFMVTADGSIEQAEVMQGLDESCNREALRVISSMPKWIPGQMGGKPVSMYYILPFTCR